MFFNINCYLLEVNEKKIKIRIIDHDSLEKFQRNIDNLYKTKKGMDLTDKKNNERDYYYLNISKKTKFNIKNFNYNNLKDLIGVNVVISGETKYYSFSIENEEGNRFFKTGYSFICNKISS